LKTRRNEPQKHTGLTNIDRRRLRIIRLVNFESGEYATIFPFLGGRVHEIGLRAGKKIFSILESPRTIAEILRNVHFAGVKLAPFPGRIVDGTYSVGGARYKLKVNSKGNFAIHGFTADKPFQIDKSIARSDYASVVLSWEHNRKTKGYPFKFRMRLTYKLSESSFSCTTEILNTDSTIIPMGDGWHPYFKTAGSVKRLSLSLPKHSVVDVTSPYKVPTGTSQKSTSGEVTIPLRQKEIPAVYDFGTKRRRVTTRIIDPKSRVEIRLWQEAGAGKYRYLVVYRPATGTSIAVEPWTCAPNAFNNGMGLMLLKPGKVLKGSYGVSLKKR